VNCELMRSLVMRWRAEMYARDILRELAVGGANRGASLDKTRWEAMCLWP